MASWQKTLIAGLALIGPAYCGLMLSGVPTLICPFPFMTIIPAFILSSMRLQLLAIFIPTVLFFLWSPRLFQGQNRVPNRSLILLGVLTALTTVFFIGSRQYGLKYQGPAFTYATCAINIAWIILLWPVFIWARSKKSFHANLLAHILMFVWIGWYAFPYLGELP